MVVKSFTYLKEKENQVKACTIVSLREDAVYVEGLSLEYLSQEDILKVKQIFKTYEEALAPFVKKAWRRYSVKNMGQIVTKKELLQDS